MLQTPPHASLSPLNIVLNFCSRLCWITVLPAVSSSLVKPIRLVLLVGLALLYLRGVVARPVPASGSIEQRSFLSSPSSCNELGHCRTKWNIIWSCLTTIFSCTWVALHPNIPEIRGIKAAQDRISDQVLLLLTALCTPEIIVIFALRQKVAARKLTTQHNEKYGGTSHLWLSIADCPNCS